jgi:hypothetical protein
LCWPTARASVFLERGNTVTQAEHFKATIDQFEAGSSGWLAVLKELDVKAKTKAYVPGRDPLILVHIFSDGSAWDQKTGITYTALVDFPRDVHGWAVLKEIETVPVISKTATQLFVNIPTGTLGYGRLTVTPDTDWDSIKPGDYVTPISVPQPGGYSKTKLIKGAVK